MNKLIAVISINVILCAVSISTMVAGGDRTNVQGFGMAHTSTSVARGIDALGINPANLGYQDRGTVTFDLIPPISVHLGNDFFDYELYTTYFTGDGNGNGRLLTDADKQDILARFPEGKATSYLDVDLKSIAFSIQGILGGSVAFGVIDHVNATMTVPNDYVKFLLEGNPLGSSFNFSETNFSAAWTREYSLTYGHTIPQLKFLKSMTAGLGLKLVHGFGYVDVQRNNTFFTTDASGAISGQVDFSTREAGVDFLSGNEGAAFSSFPSPAGTGYGFDIGVSGYFNDAFSFGAAITDIGSITWKSNTQERYGFAQFNVDDPFLSDQIDSLKEALKGLSRPTDEFSTGLPTTLRLGTAFHIRHADDESVSSRGDLILALDYTQGLATAPGVTRKPRISLGAEYRLLGFFPVRSGISIGGTDGMNVAFGFGLHFGAFDLDLATENMSAAVSPSRFKNASIAIGTRIRL